ncbi:MAG TPA: glycine zipper domain-containing protein [Candidatus Deferrimicrobiaceae bacterium]
MRNFACAVVAVLFLASLAGGCAQTGQAVRENPKTAIGAGTGVVGGAVVGGLLGGKRGAVIGGLLGGLAGGAIGHYMDNREKTLAETSRDYGYKPAQGIRLKIESLRPNPTLLAPGETVNINLTYAVLTPSVDRQVLVRETREILVNGNSVGRTSVEIEREGGTWKSIVPITLPADAPPGTYRVVASIESAGIGRDVRESNFKVQQ